MKWDSSEEITKPFGQTSFGEFGLNRKVFLKFVFDYFKSDWPEMFLTYKPSFTDIKLCPEYIIPHVTFTLTHPYPKNNLNFFTENLQRLSDSLSSRFQCSLKLSVVVDA